MKVSIFGLGYVGCVTAACLPKDNHEVIGVDVMASKVERLAAGQPTVVETGIEELIAEAHAQGRISATTNGRSTGKACRRISAPKRKRCRRRWDGTKKN